MELIISHHPLLSAPLHNLSCTLGSLFRQAQHVGFMWRSSGQSVTVLHQHVCISHSSGRNNAPNMLSVRTKSGSGRDHRIQTEWIIHQCFKHSQLFLLNILVVKHQRCCSVVTFVWWSRQGCSCSSGQFLLLLTVEVCGGEWLHRVLYVFFMVLQVSLFCL